MRIRPLHIVLLLVVVCFVSCHKEKLIPRKELTDIVFEMLVRDQQLKGERRITAIPDTLLVYEGIFEDHDQPVKQSRSPSMSAAPPLSSH